MNQENKTVTPSSRTLDIPIRSFNENQRLYLNFYKGMSREEFIQIVKNDYNSDPNNFNLGKRILSNEKEIKIKTSNSPKQGIDFQISNGDLLDPIVYYKFNTNIGEFFCEIKPVFNKIDSSLTVDKLELQNIILDFHIRDDMEMLIKYSKLEICNKLYSEIRYLYQSKYGSPKSQSARNDNYFNESFELFLEDSFKNLDLKSDVLKELRARMFNKLLFIDKKRNLIISLGSIGKESIRIEYGLYNEYLKIQEDDKKLKLIEERERLEKIKRTQSEI